MTGFFGKLFGGKKEEKLENSPEGVVENTLVSILNLSGLELSVEVEKDVDTGDIFVELFGEDEGLAKDREGQLLDAFQLYLRRAVQHQFPDDILNINVDCGGFREEARQSLLELAEKLKDVAVDKGKPVYFRALPPRDRKVVHQYLAEDGRVKSRSVGDGLYKKIKIYPIKGQSSLDGATESAHA
ncbi:MAG: hypothetical protein H6626_11685 [Pseudobdellovibrionaceae bacterium]|nr:hypothetical protein [Bdellovibrionales bacterium]USN46849.1 MAG: hypothetical protein H6626_11685 [Pseudobdellovibrionaceae bacterium]